jgi:chloramphenicol 3-O-phosphotransferase
MSQQSQDKYKLTWEDVQRIDESIRSANRAFGLATEAVEYIEDGARVERNLREIVRLLHNVRFLLLGVSLNMEDGPDRITKGRKPVEPALANMIRDIFSTAYAPYGVDPEKTSKLMGGAS